MGRKITILGMGPSAYERKIDMNRYCIGEKWSLNNAYSFYRSSGIKFDRFFELHKWQYLKTWDNNSTQDHFDALHELGCPVYVNNHLPIIHNQVMYPIGDVFRHFKTNYFLGSPSLMIALALYEHDQGEKIEEIRSWGIDTSDPTHNQQRQSWAYWLSKVQERGIGISGTAFDFASEYEKDDGLRGLREYIGDQLSIETKKAEETATEME
jgi:hypothetical protein